MIKDVARYDKGVVRGEAKITSEGFLKARAIVTRCGVFLYKNPDGTVRKELRHPDDVLQTESLDSMKMVPMVDGHPPERLVTASNAKKLSIGYTGEVVEKEMPFIVANLIITDAASVKEVKSKKKNQLSLGYTVDLVPEKGLYYGEPYEFRQTNIRYNHLALVDQARAGPEARIALDRCDAIEITKEEAKKMSMKKIVFDAQEYMVEGDVHEHIMKLHEHHKKLMDELESSKEALRIAEAQRDAMKDSVTEKLENSKEGLKFPGHKEGQGETHTHHKMGESGANEEERKMGKDNLPHNMHHMREKDEIGANGKEMKDPVDSYGMQSHVRDYTPPVQMRNNPVNGPKGNEHYPMDLPHISKVDQADIIKLANHRVKLYRFAERFLDKSSLSRMDSMSNFDIKRAIIKAKCPKANLDGKDVHYVNARFDMLMDEIPTEKPKASPIKYDRGVNTDRDQSVDAESSRSKMIKNMQNSWKVGSK